MMSLESKWTEPDNINFGGVELERSKIILKATLVPTSIIHACLSQNCQCSCIVGDLSCIYFDNIIFLNHPL